MLNNLCVVYIWLYSSVSGGVSQWIECLHREGERGDLMVFLLMALKSTIFSDPLINCLPFGDGRKHAPRHTVPQPLQSTYDMFKFSSHPIISDLDYNAAAKVHLQLRKMFSWRFLVINIHTEKEDELVNRYYRLHVVVTVLLLPLREDKII